MARGPRRSRLAVEITVALVIKFMLLYALWAVWFAHPSDRHLDAAGIAASLFGVESGRANRVEPGNDPRP